jgi:hypothetical protein
MSKKHGANDQRYTPKNPNEPQRDRPNRGPQSNPQQPGTPGGSQNPSQPGKAKR